MSHRVFEAGREVLRPIVFSIGIIIVVYLPILTFQEVEGKMFRPMALTVIFALAGSLLFALTYIPVMASLVLKKPSQVQPWLARQADRIHERVSAFSMRHRRPIVLATGLILTGSLASALLLGTEFIPTLDEGALNLDVMQLPSISLENAITNSGIAERALMELPEVAHVVSRIGRPEIATDTIGPDESDVYIFFKDKDHWRVDSKEDLISEIKRTLNERIPGMRFGFSQPIESRVNDMIAGVKGDVAIHIYGDDMDAMMKIGDKIMQVVGALPGAGDIKMVPRTGLPSVSIAVDRAAVARYGINAADVLDAVETIGGHVSGQVIEGEGRYPLQVRFAETARRSLEQLNDIKVATPSGTLLPLSELAKVSIGEGPVAIWRQDLKRQITVAVNVRGTDLGSFVANAKRAVAKQIELPRGWWLEWGGQYESLQRASARLLVLVPASLLLIVILLYNTFTSMRMALLIFSNVLLGASGGITALLLRGLAFSITAGVGFITLFGVSVLNGVVLVSEINRVRESGRPLDDAIASASRDRLRPILMASLVALFGFIPMALSYSDGAEVQRPLATVVIGGLLTSTPFTLYVLPILYGWLAARSGENGTDTA